METSWWTQQDTQALIHRYHEFGANIHRPNPALKAFLDELLAATNTDLDFSVKVDDRLGMCIPSPVCHLCCVPVYVSLPFWLHVSAMMSQSMFTCLYLYSLVSSCQHLCLCLLCCVSRLTSMQHAMQIRADVPDHEFCAAMQAADRESQGAAKVHLCNNRMSFTVP